MNAPEISPSDDIILDVRGLSAEARSEDGAKPVLDGVSFALRAGETLCIAGESGSGKSITALSLMGLLPGSVRITGGEALLAGRDLLALTERDMRRVRGDDIAMIFQEPMTSLNPVMTIGRQLVEAIRMHRDISGRAARARALEMLEAVRLSEPARRLGQYPHELSGGMRQRAIIAMALSCRPRVLIADEPTTALDVTVQAQILALINDLKRAFGTAVVLITHDMGVVAEMADRVLVMNRGRVVETGGVHTLFAAPCHPYTAALLAAVPRLGSLADQDGPRRGAVPGDGAARAEPVVRVRDLTVRFDIRGGLLQQPVRRVHAVEGVSFAIMPGETLALVGESGCGKSTTGKALLNLVPWSGEVEIAGCRTAGLSERAMRPVRRNIQMIFQDPFASLDPRMTVGEAVAEPLIIHRLAPADEIDERVAWLFERVGLKPEHRRRHPHAFSGGQRQRICIARALSVEPRVIVADESVSALDVSVQAQVLDLMQELQAELGIAYLFISHDMAVVERISHRVAVMVLGQIVEIGPRRAVFTNPCHAYTRRLLDSVPIADPARRRAFSTMAAEVPTPIRPLGFTPRPVALKDHGDGHLAADAMPS